MFHNKSLLDEMIKMRSFPVLIKKKTLNTKVNKHVTNMY